MQRKIIKEMVVYTIKSNYRNRVNEIQETVKSCLKDFKGLIKVESYQSTSDDLVLMDWVDWESLEDAKQAQREFENHPKFSTLMNYIGEMKFSDHFIN